MSETETKQPTFSLPDEAFEAVFNKITSGEVSGIPANTVLCMEIGGVKFTRSVEAVRMRIHFTDKPVPKDDSYGLAFKAEKPEALTVHILGTTISPKQPKAEKD